MVESRYTAQIPFAKLADGFNKTAGVCDATVARRFVCRLNEYEIVHMATPFGDDKIRILVRSSDLARAIDLKPDLYTKSLVTRSKNAIPSRFLISIPAGAFIGSALSFIVPLNQGFLAIAGAAFIVLMSEALYSALKSRTSAVTEQA